MGMEKMELSTREQGDIGELLMSRSREFPEPFTDLVTSHVNDRYAEFIPEPVNPAVRLEAHKFHGEITLAAMEGIDLQRPAIEDHFGFSSGWIPDLITSATWRISDHRFENSHRSLENTDWNDEETPPVVTYGSYNRDQVVDAKIYYPVEVKTTSRQGRVRLTNNQLEMLAVLDDQLEYVHPIIVSFDISALPEAVGIEVDLYEDSEWGDGAMSKTIRLQDT